MDWGERVILLTKAISGSGKRTKRGCTDQKARGNTVLEKSGDSAGTVSIVVILVT